MMGMDRFGDEIGMDVFETDGNDWTKRRNVWTDHPFSSLNDYLQSPTIDGDPRNFLIRLDTNVDSSLE